MVQQVSPAWIACVSSVMGGLSYKVWIEQDEGARPEVEGIKAAQEIKKHKIEPQLHAKE